MYFDENGVEQVSVGDVLNIAIDELKRRGLNKRSFYNTHGVDIEDAPVCIMGAINVVGNPTAPDCSWIGATNIMEMVRNKIGCELAWWNGRPERTVEEVVALLASVRDENRSTPMVDAWAGSRVRAPWL